MAQHSYEVAESGDRENGKIDPSKVPFWTSSRLGLAILGFFGFVNVYALRVNMTVAIVCMVNQTALRLMNAEDAGNNKSAAVSDCGLIHSGISNETKTQDSDDGSFVWSKEIQGHILGSFFYGYLVTQVPGGWLATKIGGKRVYGFCMLAATVATFLTPIAAETHYIFLIVMRVIMGVTSGVCYPSMHSLWGNWAPPMERTKLVGFTYAGAQVGNVITFPLASLLCKYGFAGGWPSIFYVLGCTSLVWFVLWMIFVSDSPTQHRRISKIERDYIVQSLQDSVSTAKPTQRISVPWLSMLKSMPVWALLVANICSDWGTYTLLTSISSYMHEVLAVDIASNGLYSALPYIAFWAMINISGWVADFIRSRGILNTQITRKTFTSLGMILPACMLIGVGFVDCTQPAVAIALLTLGISLTGLQYSGWVVNHMDIAPAFAGILFGITNSIASCTGFLSPVVVGMVTKDQSRENWQVVFYIAAAIYAFGAIFWIVFSKGEIQKWAAQEHHGEPEAQRLNTELQSMENGKIIQDDSRAVLT